MQARGRKAVETVGDTSIDLLSQLCMHWRQTKEWKVGTMDDGGGSTVWWAYVVSVLQGRGSVVSRVEGGGCRHATGNGMGVLQGAEKTTCTLTPMDFFPTHPGLSHHGCCIVSRVSPRDSTTQGIVVHILTKLRGSFAYGKEEGNQAKKLLNINRSH
ncbi:hypothetical protein BDN70DRAFT_901929 [Pholiota conissans]|uniref:Uncharacterized protein n=1 Tax=Pholiota conissans TaxID=109636 RepID=A0A9P5YMS4_9AGAR|nr:hypothetical protein BDN70DRAFT_901929 [Pholiota conissans]